MKKADPEAPENLTLNPTTNIHTLKPATLEQPVNPNNKRPGKIAERAPETKSARSKVLTPSLLPARSPQTLSLLRSARRTGDKTKRRLP